MRDARRGKSHAARGRCCVCRACRPNSAGKRRRGFCEWGGLAGPGWPDRSRPARPDFSVAGPGEASVASPAREDEVRRRAYEIYLERGAEPGRELNDWLQAERELNSGVL